VPELIEVERPADGIAVLSLNDPEHSNRLSWAAVDRLASRLAEVRGVRSPGGIAGIPRIAARVDAGESMRDIYRDLAKAKADD